MAGEHVFRAAVFFGANGQFNYTGPREGSDLLEFVGPAKGKITAGAKGKGYAEPKHPLISWTVALNDVACEGCTIVSNKPLTGTDSGGQPNERHTMDVLLSSGYFGPTDEANLANTIATMANWFGQQLQADPNFQLTGDQIIEMVVGREVTVDIGTTVNVKTGNPISTIDNFITMKQYQDKAKNPGMFRQKRPEPQAPRTVASGGVVAPVGAIGGPGAVPGRPAPTAITAPPSARPTLAAPPAFITPPAAVAAANGAQPAITPPPFALPGVGR